MKNRRWPRWILCVAWLAGTGCMTLKEVPRSEFAARPERKHVRVTTTEGLVYEFDYVEVAGDTLTGYRERDTESTLPEMATLQIGLNDIDRLSVRGVDWYKTGLIGGGAIAAVVAAGLSNNKNDKPAEGGDSGGNPPRPIP